MVIMEGLFGDLFGAEGEGREENKVDKALTS